MWNEIPKAAMLTTFDLEDFVSRVSTPGSTMYSILRLDILEKTSGKALRKTLVSNAGEMSEPVAAGLADLLKLVTFAPDCDAEYIASMIAEIVAGTRLVS